MLNCSQLTSRLTKRAGLCRFGGVEWGLLPHLAADPHTTPTHRGAFLDGRDQRPFVDYAGDQAFGVGERNENTHRPLGFQRDTGLGAAEQQVGGRAVVHAGIFEAANRFLVRQ